MSCEWDTRRLRKKARSSFAGFATVVQSVPQHLQAVAVVVVVVDVDVDVDVA